MKPEPPGANKTLLPIALALLLGVTALSGAPAVEEDAPFDIRLGHGPAPPPKPDPALVRATEQFLAARQTASLDRSREAAVRRLMGGSAKVDAEKLLGNKEWTIVAFDFQDAAIEPKGPGRFGVPVYIVFADWKGRVAETRDEMLVFSGGRGSYVCVGLQPASALSWNSVEAADAADRLGARDALEGADRFLRGWVRSQSGPCAYSIEDVYPAGPGRILVPCLRFTSRFGKRGYEVLDSPLVLSRGPQGYRLEASTTD